jgi:hypothetical protein
VQTSDANASYVGEIFRAHECFAPKTWKHQAHQLSTCGFDRQARGEAGGGGKVIDAARFPVRLKQFVNRIAGC